MHSDLSLDEVELCSGHNELLVRRPIERSREDCVTAVLSQINQLVSPRLLRQVKPQPEVCHLFQRRLGLVQNTRRPSQKRGARGWRFGVTGVLEQQNDLLLVSLRLVVNARLQLHRELQRNQPVVQRPVTPGHRVFRRFVVQLERLVDARFGTRDKVLVHGRPGQLELQDCAGLVHGRVAFVEDLGGAEERSLHHRLHSQVRLQ